ncbi:MAG: magnesium transporter [Robiginitomaculum sp.]|nr:magnesium transporter [Robiginitomaculum sp.]
MVQMMKDIIKQETDIDQTSGTEIDSVALEDLCRSLSNNDPQAAKIALASLHAADASDVIEQLSNDQLRQLASFAPDVFTGEILAELSDPVLEKIVEILDAKTVADAIGALESDDAIQVVEELEAEFRDEVLKSVNPKERQALETSLAFEPDSVGRLMQREFVAVPAFFNVEQAINNIRQSDDTTMPDTFYEVYVVDPSYHVVGLVALPVLLRAKSNTPLSELMSPVQIAVTQQTDKEDAAYMFEKYDLPSAPVTDQSGRLVGMITIDDMVEVMHDEHTEDLLSLAGVNEAGLGDTVKDVVLSRAPWLIVNLATAVLTSMVISIFDASMEKIIALAVLMPIVASMGGNAATQGLTVAVRALALREITKANAGRIIVREMVAGLVHGLIFAIIMGLVTFVWFKSLPLALILASAMVINHLVAGFAGILVPLGLKRLGADPAVASSVFVTTVTDIVGFFVFLGLAALVLVS